MNQQNIDKLKALKLSGMAEAYESLCLKEANKEMDFDTLLGILIDHEESRRKNNKLHRLLKQAAFPEEASIGIFCITRIGNWIKIYFCV